MAIDMGMLGLEGLTVTLRNGIDNQAHIFHRNASQQYAISQHQGTSDTATIAKFGNNGSNIGSWA